MKARWEAARRSGGHTSLKAETGKLTKPKPRSPEPLRLLH